MRHIIRRLKRHLPAEQQKRSGAAGPHLARLRHHHARGAPARARARRRRLHQGHRFLADGLTARREAGYTDARDMLARRPWLAPVDPMEGVIIHQNAPMTERLAKS